MNQTLYAPMATTKKMKNEQKLSIGRKTSDIRPKHEENKVNRKSTPSQISIVGDSMLNNIDEGRLSKRDRRVKVRPFPGANTEDLKHYIKPIATRKPNIIIVHRGTNDLKDNTTTEIIENLLEIK